jgi:hypothetical protein
MTRKNGGHRKVDPAGGDPPGLDPEEVVEVTPDRGPVVRDGNLVILMGPALAKWILSPEVPVAGGAPIHSTLTLWHDGWNWRLSLHWRARGLVVYARRSTLEAALLEANKWLENDNAPWRLAHEG